MSRFRQRVAIVSVALLIGGVGSQLRAADQRQPATPAKSSNEFAQEYGRVGEWRGSWNAMETETFDRSGEAGRKSLQKLFRSSGRFVLKPATDPSNLGWFPADRSYEWRGEGTVVAENTIHWEGWDHDGIGSSEDHQSAGTLPTTGGKLLVRLDPDYLSVSVGWPDERLKPGIRTRVVYRGSESQGYARLTRETDGGDFDATGVLPPLRELNRVGGPKLKGGGPRVLTFSDEDAHDGYRYASQVTMYPVYDDVEVEVTIDGYETWLPRGNIAAPNSPGSKLTAHASLVAKGKGAQSPPQVKHFRFELTDVSREPGICLNWPRFGPMGDTPPAQDPNPDLRFAARRGVELGEEALAAMLEPVKDREGRASADAPIDCYDFGGYGTLRVVCVLEDGREILGILKQAGDDLAMIPLPWSRSGSHIAKVWTDRVALTGGDGDDGDDQPAGDGQRGDGFSNYEEYRGFAQMGDHLRTKPGRKDLFVRNRLGSRALPGIFRYTDLTGLAVHYELRESELPDSRRLNVNRSADSPRKCAADQFQHGLIIDRVETGDASITHVVGDLWRPQFVSSVNILTSLFAPGSEDELATTIAHELMHAIGVHHHGEDDDYVAWLRKSEMVEGKKVSWFEERMARQNPITKQMEYRAQPKTRIRIFVDEDHEISPEGDYLPGPKILFLGHYGQQHSGDVNCVMRYFCAEAYLLPSRPRDRFLSQPEAPGTGLCAAPNGTDFNAGSDRPGRKLPRYSDATLGGCKDMFCVRDDAPNLDKKK